MWSAAVDARVLAARAAPASNRGQIGRPVLGPVARRLRSAQVEHLLIDRSEFIRIDLVGASSIDEPFVLHFDLADDEWLDERVTMIRALRGPGPARCHLQLARRLLCLHAIDARDAGASLKDIADHVLGPGDWPGDGDHRKSKVRRMIAEGDRMCREGPRAILRGRSSPWGHSTPFHRKNREDAG